MSQIVPEDLRSLVYAFDRSLESSLAACAAPAVGLIAERYYGFSGAVSQDSLADAVLRGRNADALASSLLACMALPWAACLAFYTVLHFTYVSACRCLVVVGEVGLKGTGMMMGAPNLDLGCSSC